MALARVCGRSPESRDICHVIWNAGALRITHEKVVSPIVGGTRNVFVPSITPYFGLNFRGGPCPGGGLGANLEWDGPRCERPRESQHEEQHCVCAGIHTFQRKTAKIRSTSSRSEE